MSAKLETELGLEKQCTRCHDFWPADAEFFYAAGSAKDGLMSECKACFAEKNAANVAKYRQKRKGGVTIVSAT